MTTRCTEIAKGAQLARSAGRRSIWRALTTDSLPAIGAIPVAQIVARAAEDARRFYWPTLEARWAAQNGESPGVPRASIFAESANNPPIWVQLELPTIR